MGQQMTDLPDKRKDDRLAVRWQGVLSGDNGLEDIPCDVVDISEAGALVRADVTPPMDADLLLTIDGLGDFAGRVKWVGNKSVGLMLLAGSDLDLKKFAVKAGAETSTHPDADIDV